MHLALRCLAKDPRGRPATFLAVLAELDRIAGPVNARNMHRKSHSLFHEHQRFQKAVRPLVVRTLVQIGELRLALSELDDMPDDVRDAPYWAMRGSVLAQVDRHEEALECFDRALNDCATDDRYEWESERALSLKRLGRSDEAIAVYHRLLHEVPDDVVPTSSEISRRSTSRGRSRTP
jgi:tetratricopeptide (TPR) repeat protein